MKYFLRRRKRPGQKKVRGMALLIALIMIAVLTGATLALATLASGDIEIAASERMGTVAFNVAEGGLDEVLTDAKTALPPSGGGYAPDPFDAVLEEDYVPVTSQADSDYSAKIQYVRNGMVEESSALEVRSIVYNVSVVGNYRQMGNSNPLARTTVNGEFYRIAPRTSGVVTKARHFQ